MPKILRAVEDLTPMEVKVLRRFLARTQKSKGCWIWTGGKFQGSDYGDFRALGECRAHRVSYLLHVGEIPDKMLVLHKCDNPPCVNPHHLWLGTPLDNMKDMIDKGRDDKVKGMRHPAATITDEDVLEIRRTYNETNGKRGVQAILCRKFNLSRPQIYAIVHGKSWKHLLPT